MTWLLISIILLMSLVPTNRIIQVPEPYAIPTYESIGVYAPYVGNKVSFRYRIVDGTWYQGMDMVPDYREMVMGINEAFVPNKYKNEWRASILRARPDTEYEIELTYDNGSTKNIVTRTRSNVFPTNGNVIDVHPGQSITQAIASAQPGDTVSIFEGTYNENVRIRKVGRPDAYIRIRGYNALINGTRGTGVYIDDSAYVIISDVEVTNARTGVHIGGTSHNIVLDYLNVNDVQFVTPPSNAIRIGNGSQSPVHSITVQNSYLEGSPGGTHATIHFFGTEGKHVIRHNHMEYKHRGTQGVHGADCVAGYPNQGDRGTGHDVDIYGNRCIGATDDGIEFDGSARNVRVFDNHISGAMSGFAIAPISIGPGFLFNNTVDRPQLQWTNGCHAIKSGESGDGHIYIFHNTFHMLSDSCTGRGLVSAGGGMDSPNTFIYNNVFHVEDRIMNVNVPQTPTTDHNIVYAETPSSVMYMWGAGRNYRTFSAFRTATGQEAHGAYIRPQYVNEEAYDLRLINSPIEPKLLIGMNQVPRLIEVLEPAPIGAR